MSMDVHFYAFSESRSDQEWEKFWRRTDVRQTLGDLKARQARIGRLQELNEKEQGLRSAATYLERHGVSPPKADEQEDIPIDEDVKYQLLLQNTEAALDRGEIDWQPEALTPEEAREQKEIDSSLTYPERARYFGIELKKDGAVSEVARREIETEEVPGTEPILELHIDWYLSPESSGTRFGREELLNDLMKMDLRFSSEWAYISAGGAFSSYLHALFVIFVPEASDSELSSIDYTGVPPQDKLILLFQRITRDKIAQALSDPEERHNKAINMDSEDISELIEFAKDIRPVVKDLKENGSRLIVTTDYDAKHDPVLVARAEKHLNQLLEKYPDLKTRLE